MVSKKTFVFKTLQVFRRKKDSGLRVQEKEAENELD